MRTGADQTTIKERAKKANNIVIVGGGFISSEVTANLAKTYKDKVSLVCNSNVPLEHVYGYEIGSMLQFEHERNGAKVYNNRDVTQIKYTGD